MVTDKRGDIPAFLPFYHHPYSVEGDRKAASGGLCMGLSTWVWHRHSAYLSILSSESIRQASPLVSNDHLKRHRHSTKTAERNTHTHAHLFYNQAADEKSHHIVRMVQLCICDFELCVKVEHCSAIARLVLWLICNTLSTCTFSNLFLSPQTCVLPSSF